MSEPLEPPGYGAPPPPPQPYQQQPYAYATWGQRAIALLWDSIVYVWMALVLMLIGYIVVIVGAARDSGALVAVGLLLTLAAVVIGIWRTITNYMLDQGRTGYTYGKRKVGIRTVRTADGQPSGVGMCVARYFLHSLINQACYLDYLWPLWDPMRQTLTDKILSTVVVQQPDTSS